MKSSDRSIGIVSCDSPPFIGGMGRHVGSLCEGFHTAGVTAHIVDRTHRPYAWACGRNIGFSLGVRRTLENFVHDHGITLLQVHVGPGGVLLPFFPSTVPVVLTVNHTYAAQSRLLGQYWKKIFIPFERRMYEHAQQMIAISEDTANSLENDYGIPRERIAIIHCGFELSPWIHADCEESDRDHRSCVFIGRPDVRKGWDLLRNAWSIVRKNMPHATLAVVGWDDVSRDGISFLGRLSDQDLRSLIGRARTTICPSRLEGFGLTAAESIACGTPVVATSVAGLQRVVHEKRSGIFVDINPISIAHGVITMLQDDFLWRQLHDGCRVERARFDITKEIHAHLTLFDAVYSS